MFTSFVLTLCKLGLFAIPFAMFYAAWGPPAIGKTLRKLLRKETPDEQEQRLLMLEAQADEELAKAIGEAVAPAPEPPKKQATIGYYELADCLKFVLDNVKASVTREEIGQYNGRTKYFSRRVKSGKEFYACWDDIFPYEESPTLCIVSWEHCADASFTCKDLAGGIPKIIDVLRAFEVITAEEEASVRAKYEEKVRVEQLAKERKAAIKRKVADTVKSLQQNN